MTSNPFYNAVLAAGYITLVSFVIFYGLRNARPIDSILAPMTLLSLFVLSAAVMGFLFLYQPGILYFDGRKVEAVSLFLKTLGIFACLTIVLFATLILSTK